MKSWFKETHKMLIFGKNKWRVSAINPARKSSNLSKSTPKYSSSDLFIWSGESSYCSCSFKFYNITFHFGNGLPSFQSNCLSCPQSTSRTIETATLREENSTLKHPSSQELPNKKESIKYITLSQKCHWKTLKYNSSINR